MPKFAEMTEEQKRAKFDEWVTKREGKTVQNKAKNAARGQILSKYKAEYTQAFSDILKGTKIEKPNEEKAREIIQTWIEKKAKGKARQGARKAVLDAHKTEYQKVLDKAQKEAQKEAA